MQFQTVNDKSLGDSIFRSVYSGITATSTAAALQPGEPVILATATIRGALGQEVIRALEASNVVMNRFLVGAVGPSPIAHESMGLVQVYGVAPVRLAEAATVAVPNALVPDLNTTATALAPYGRGCWVARTETDTAIHTQSGAKVLVVAPATAVSGTLSYTNGYAFIRAL